MSVDVLENLQKSLDAIEKSGTANAETIKTVKEGFEGLSKDHEKTAKALEEIQKENEDFARDLKFLRQQREHIANTCPTKGKVTDECATWLTASFLVGARAKGVNVNENVLKVCQEAIERDVALMKGKPMHAELKAFEDGALQRTALTTSDIPLPTGYSGQIVELVEAYGTFRRWATVMPMGDGTTNLPKLTTDPAFAFIDVSGAVGEKVPQLAFVEFAAKKAGGIVRVPSEIDEDSIVPVGQFLARYVARNIASWEDTTGWLADGTSTYKTLEGVVDRVGDNSNVVTLTSTNTSPDDITLADMRTARSLPAEAILEQDPAYYVSPNFEAKLSSFNTGGDYPWNPERNTLDGFPVRYVNKLQSYTTSAAASTVPVLFGDMSYWYLGTRGALRLDISRDVYFATDEWGLRALERFTVEEMATTHMAGITTAAS